MPRTNFRATDRRRSSRLGAAAAPDVPEMDMLHNALECVQACERGVQKSAEAGSPHAIRAGSQPRAPAGPQHERFASCERRGVRGACARQGHTFRGAGRAREAGGAPRLAEDVGLVSLGPAQPAHPPSPLAPALRALAERLQRRKGISARAPAQRKRARPRLRMARPALHLVQPPHDASGASGPAPCFDASGASSPHITRRTPWGRVAFWCETTEKKNHG